MKFQWPIVSCLCLAFFSCGRGSEGTVAQTKDIFENDAQTRHLASLGEGMWTVFTGRETASTLSVCTGSALSEKYILTANHCSPQPGDRFRSGSSVAKGEGQDLQVVRVAESSSTYDYAVLEIRWLKGTPPSDQKFIPGIATSERDAIPGVDGQGTKVITIGFPADKNESFPRTLKPVPVYAEGYAKNYADDKLYYNLGSINGNSGGAVLRADDHRLVSLTNGGAHNYGERGWDHNDPEDRKAWNFGAAMYRVYSQSTVLKQIFVNGANAHVNPDGSLMDAYANPE